MHQNQLNIAKACHKASHCQNMHRNCSKKVFGIHFWCLTESRTRDYKKNYWNIPNDEFYDSDFEKEAFALLSHKSLLFMRA